MIENEETTYEETEETEETLRLMSVQKPKRSFALDNGHMSITEKQKRDALESSGTATKVRSFVQGSVAPKYKSDENLFKEEHDKKLQRKCRDLQAQLEEKTTELRRTQKELQEARQHALDLQKAHAYFETKKKEKGVLVAQPQKTNTSLIDKRARANQQNKKSSSTKEKDESIRKKYRNAVAQIERLQEELDVLRYKQEPNDDVNEIYQLPPSQLGTYSQE